MNDLSTTTVRTMSSLEIAELTEKDHFHVMRDIKTILEEAGIDASKFGCVYKGANGQDRPMFNLPRRECDLVISGYSVKYRLAIIDRWHQLEAMSALANSPILSEEAKAAMAFAEFATRMLNLPSSAQLGMVSTLAKKYAPELIPQLPVYAIDAPPSALQLGSSKPTKSATELLKEAGSSLSARAFNVLAEAHGVIEKQQRKSTTRKGIKEFWTMTEAGLEYGKNVTNPSNPKETQPHWYTDTFDDLLGTLTM